MSYPLLFAPSWTIFVSVAYWIASQAVLFLSFVRSLRKVRSFAPSLCEITRAKNLWVTQGVLLPVAFCERFVRSYVERANVSQRR